VLSPARCKRRVCASATVIISEPQFVFDDCHLRHTRPRQRRHRRVRRAARSQS
jgi:hypothetical protein